MSNHRRRIIAPGQINIGVQVMEAPFAEPAVATIAVPDGVKVIVFGGLTKLEALAGEIAGHLSYNGEPIPSAASRAVELAAAVLDECARRVALIAQHSSARGAPELPEAPGPSEQSERSETS